MRRPSAQTTAVLHALAGDPERWRYGYELGQQVGLKAGSLYPILMRLHGLGLLDSSWEVGPPAGRPPRHLYRLTSEGVAAAAGLPAPVNALRRAGSARGSGRQPGPGVGRTAPGTAS